MPISARDNKAVVERLLDAWNNSDFHAIEESWWRPTSSITTRRRSQASHRGQHAVAVRTDYMGQAFPDGRGETVQLLTEDDKVVIFDVIRGTHQGEFMGVSPTGRQVSFEFVHIFPLPRGASSSGGASQTRWV